MAFKLIESAQRRWRMVNSPHLVALVRAGATFVNGKLAEGYTQIELADAARQWVRQENTGRPARPARDRAPAGHNRELTGILSGVAASKDC